MPIGLLQTKLYRPAQRSGCVERPRLHALLDRGLEPGRRLTLVSAPAGSGKTTLVSRWLTRIENRALRIEKAEQATTNSLFSILYSPPKVAWLSLDEDDNDPGRFWAYLIAALRTVDPGIGEPSLRALQSAQPMPARLLLPDLLNEVAGLGGPVVLVLDDYHLIGSPAIHEALAFALDHAPPNLHLVVVTRADPPLPLARLRARDHLVELRAADLRFTPEEALEFLNRSMGLSLRPGEVDTLVGRTEGWAAGLQLAALSLQGQADPRAYIESFSGEHHYVLDYLVEEVLHRQPEGVQRFLFSTSILDRLCAPLCDALLDESPTANDQSPGLLSVVRGPSSAVLADLERANLFLVPLDDERVWYRYHHLFRDLLRARLEQSDPGVIPELHRRAATWLDAHDLPASAVHHAFAARDYQLAAELIERHIPSRWALGDTAFLTMIGRLPAELVHSRPGLAIHHAFALVAFGQHQAAEAALRAMRPHLHAGPDPGQAAIASFAIVLLAYLAELRGEATQVELPDPRSLHHVPEHRLAMRNTADVIYAFLLHFRGEFAQAEELLLGAARRDMAAGGTNAAPIAIARLGRVRIVQGRLRDAAALCRQYMRQVAERGPRQFYVAGSLHLVLGDVLREWDDLAGAEREIRHGIELNELWPSGESHAIGHYLLARVLLARADVAGAGEAMREVDALIEGLPIAPDVASDVQALRVRLWLARGDLATASAWAARLSPRPPLDFRHERDQITRARVLLAQGQAAEAHALLEPLRRAAERGGRAGRQIELTLLHALALHALRRDPEALAMLAACLTLAEPEGYRRVFLDEGREVAALLEGMKDEGGRMRPYILSLLAAYTSPTAASALDPHPSSLIPHPLPEPLTRRELEVLRLICAGDANQEIAEKLVITLSAVKKHSGNIFRKLGVSSRTQAIARAIALNLLAPDP